MSKFNAWFKGLKLTSKVTLIAVLSIVFLGVVGATARPSAQTNVNIGEAKSSQQEISAPKIETKTETSAEVITFVTSNIETNSLAKGRTQIQTAGVSGTKTITYTITLTNGIETNRISTEEITTQPINEVVLIGTYVAPVSNCDPNYSGCVPIASDVDCAGGSGNGPAYVAGPVQVIGSDIYGLDRDNDGIGCE